MHSFDLDVHHRMDDAPFLDSKSLAVIFIAAKYTRIDSNVLVEGIQLRCLTVKVKVVCGF